MARTVTASEGVLAIGGFAGGIEALAELAAGLPPDLPFAVMVAVHLQVGGHAQVWR
jgi:two-component system, chemotaxis family, protein-glutamate methylesterase/glutaminase